MSFDLLFGEPKELKFEDVKFDFDLNPNHFIEWLKTDGQEIIGDYRTDVASMCEYFCLYFAMLFHDKKLQSIPVIYYGKFGFFEHYWIGYKFNGVEYFVDLTLQQFSKDAPKLAITKYMNDRSAGCYSSLSDGEPIADYIERQKAFEYYTNPYTMVKPYVQEYKLNINHLMGDDIFL